VAGVLYVTGTPIGNLSDLSPRAAETLRQVDFIAAEDTRVTLKLLNHFDIKKQLISYHEHNKRECGAWIVQRLLTGESCAIVTDAGMPCISDPGEDLVRLCAENGLTVAVVPGPSAAISALAVSGLSTQRFCFEGFLSTNRKNRMAHLEQIKNLPNTLIFYEAPHKLTATLQDMLAVFGDRRIALCRELTKLHEEVIRTTLEQCLALYEDKSPRGEYVLIIEGSVQEEATDGMTREEAVSMVLNLVRQGASLSDAAKATAKASSFKKGELYKAALEQAEGSK